MSDEPIILTKEQALSMLGGGDSIHTFRCAGFAIIGCDWERSDIEAAVRENECELGGEQCQRMNHGLVIHVGDSPLFVECQEGFDYAAFEAQVIGINKQTEVSDEGE